MPTGIAAILPTERNIMLLRSRPTLLLLLACLAALGGAPLNVAAQEASPAAEAQEPAASEASPTPDPAPAPAAAVTPAPTPRVTPEPTPTPAPLPSSTEAVQPYFGIWAVTSSFQGNPVSADIELKDVDGFVAGTFKMAFLPQPQPIDFVELKDGGISLTTKIMLGQNTIVLTLAGALQDGKIVGTIKDKMGLMSSEFEAVKSDPELDPFMASWSLDAANQEAPIRVDLFKFDGQPTGYVTPSPDDYPSAIEGVTKTPLGIDVAYDVNLPTGRVEVVMSIHREGEGVAGTLQEVTGKFADTFTGVATVPELPARLASDVDTAGFESFVGPWTLASSFQGNPFNLDLQLFDLAGKLGGVIEVPLAPSPMVLRSIQKQEDKLLLGLDLDFGGPRLQLSIEAAMVEGVLQGRLFDSSGFFDAPFTGSKATSDGTAIARAIASASGVELELGGGGRRRGGSSTARMTLGDHQFRLLYRPLGSDHADYQAFLAAAPGDVLLPTGARVPKLFIDTNLRFGDVVIPAHNFTETYPGVYGLWLRRTVDGWNLIFNSQGDAWGTMHDPAHDVSEVPMQVTELEEPVDLMTFEMFADGTGGQLVLSWGNQKLAARFEVE